MFEIYDKGSLCREELFGVKLVSNTPGSSIFKYLAAKNKKKIVNYSWSYCFNPSLETFCGWESKISILYQELLVEKVNHLLKYDNRVFADSQPSDP